MRANRDIDLRPAQFDRRHDGRGVANGDRRGRNGAWLADERLVIGEEVDEMLVDGADVLGVEYRSYTNGFTRCSNEIEDGFGQRRLVGRLVDPALCEACMIGAASQIGHDKR